MPSIHIPRITREIHLSDYQPEYVDEQGNPVTLHIWVNPPRSVMDGWRDIQRGWIELVAEGQKSPSDDETILEARGNRVIELNHRLCDWFAQVWSQKPGAETWTQEEVNNLIAHFSDSDPMAWDWIRDKTLEAIRQYRELKRKN